MPKPGSRRARASRPRSRTRRPIVAPSRSNGSTSATLTMLDGPRRRARPTVGRAGGCLARPRVILLGADRRPGLAEPGDARARQPGDAVRERALAEREHVEPVGARLERVRVLEREVDEAVALAHLVRRAGRPRPPTARRRPSRRARRRSPPRRPRGGAASTTFPGSTWMRLTPTELRRTSGQARPRAGDVPALAAPGPRTSSQCEITSRSCHAASADPQISRRRALRHHLPPRRDHASASSSSARSSAIELGRLGARPVERLDPLESLEHRSRLVHAIDGSPARLTDG